MLQPIHFIEGIRIVKRRYLGGIRKYPGTWNQICRQIIENCWNGTYYQVSDGHFSEFYCRDFGWVVKSLIKLGHKNQVIKTLEYALITFAKFGKITTTIDPKGRPFDFPTYAPDSLAFFLYSLAQIKRTREGKKLIKKHKEFLESELARFYKIALENNGLIKKHKTFSSMKDHSVRNSSCYDNCMAYMIQRYANELNLNGVKKFNYKKLIEKNFWNGKYFKDDLDTNYVSGDSNVLPFWSGVIKNKAKLKSVIKYIQKEKLDQPLPISYTAPGNKKVKLKWFSVFVYSYERDVLWTHMGPLWIEVVGDVDKKLQKSYIVKYRSIIEKYGNYLETLNRDLTPYKSPIYLSDESMIWAANILTL